MLSKKRLRSNIPLFFLLASSVSYAVAPPASVSFEATAKITQNSCQLAPTQAVSISSVAFDKLHDVTYVSSHGSDANATLFVLGASHCSPGQVNASIIGTADSTDADLLAIAHDSDSAQNVAIAFMTESKGGNMVLVPVNTGTTETQESDESVNNFIFMIQPVKETNMTPVAGKIHATAQIRINYL